MVSLFSFQGHQGTFFQTETYKEAFSTDRLVLKEWEDLTQNIRRYSPLLMKSPLQGREMQRSFFQDQHSPLSTEDDKDSAFWSTLVQK